MCVTKITFSFLSKLTLSITLCLAGRPQGKWLVMEGWWEDVTVSTVRRSCFRCAEQKGVIGFFYQC